MDLNDKHKETLLNILANPANVSKAYADDLHSMVSAYPQSGLLQALYARATAQSNPTYASASFNSAILHKLYYHPDSLLPVNATQLIVLEDGEPETNQSAVLQDIGPETQPVELPDFLNISWPDNQQEDNEVAANEQAPDEDVVSEADDNAFAEPVTFQEQETVPVNEPPVNEQYNTPEAYETENNADEEISAENIITPQQAEPVDTIEERAPWEMYEESEYGEDTDDTEPIIDEEPQPEYTNNVQERAPWEEDGPEQDEAERAPWETIADEYAKLSTDVHPAPVNSDKHTDIEEEVYDEITGIDEIEIVQQPADVSSEPVAEDEALIEQPVTDAGNNNDDAEKLILGNIAATDYFVFDRAFNDKKTEEEIAAEEPKHEQFFAQGEDIMQDEVHHDVSKYHDEKMPYTFMWWLDKTRKEHGQLYQPYSNTPVNSPVKKAVNDELQQQYIENIFHLAPVDKIGTEDSSKTIEFDMQSKEDRIIQRFITEDPQIHPPVGEKLDTENKAKRSSEDSNDIVTETLARIYADQMLYQKAIATYKKLMLKYPEKSRYFASRIENLEKRTN